MSSWKVAALAHLLCPPLDAIHFALRPWVAFLGELHIRFSFLEFAVAALRIGFIVSTSPQSEGEIEHASRSGRMDAEPDPVPSFLPLQLPQSDADAFIDELYFESENAEGRLPQESVMSELNESRTELFSRVQTLKKDLKDWRGVLNTQVKSYREEIGDLRDSLNSEVERLKTEFSNLRSTINNQVEKATSKLAELNVPEETLSSPKPDDSVPVKVSSSNVSTE